MTPNLRAIKKSVNKKFKLIKKFLTLKMKLRFLVNQSSLNVPKGYQMKRKYWQRGQRAKLALAVGISQGHLHDMLNRKHLPKYALCIELAKHSKIPLKAWLNSQTSKHPAFSGKPQKTA
jgi:hypothetical protein